MKRTQGGSCGRCPDSIRVVATPLQARGLPRQCGGQPQVCPVLTTGTKIPVGRAESFHSIADRSCVDRHLYLERRDSCGCSAWRPGEFSGLRLVLLGEGEPGRQARLVKEEQQQPSQLLAAAAHTPWWALQIHSEVRSPRFCSVPPD